MNAQARQWLKDHKFPVGHILVLPSGPEAFGAKLDELHAAGWKTLKIGVGRTKAFAEVFVQRRLEAVMVPEPAKGDAPRKAKVAKGWKEVRKKMCGQLRGSSCSWNAHDRNVLVRHAQLRTPLARPLVGIPSALGEGRK